MTATRSPKNDWIWLALILAGAAVTFGSLLKAGPLTWDDDSNIFSNPYFLSGDWAAAWRDPYNELYVPVASTVWQALHFVGRGAAWPFRAFNLILHLANAALVFGLLKGLARRWSMPAFTVLLGTALFALHPLQVHAVAWISGGRDLLAAFFALASLAVYFAGPMTARRYAFASVLFLFSILSKPSAILLPIVILGLEWILNAQLGRGGILRMGVWAIFSGAVAWLTKLAQADFPLELTLKDRLSVTLDSYSFYLQKFVAPYSLSANYGRTPEVALGEGTFAASVIMTLAVLAGFAFLSWRRDRRYSLIMLWFLAILPVSGILPFAHQLISTVSDHYNYLPMALLAALAAFVLSRIEWRKELGQTLLAVLVLGLTVLSWSRARAWSNDEAFFTDMSKQSPDSYATALGMSIVMCEDVKNFEEGVKWTEIALKAKPLDIVALANQAYCFLHARNYFRVIELEYYLGQLNIDEIEATQPTAYSSLLSSIGSAYIEQQEYEDGFQFLCEAVRVKPSEPGHQRNLEIAKEILKSKGIEPTCEQVQAPEEGTEPIQEIWPQLDQEPDGGAGE